MGTTKEIKVVVSPRQLRRRPYREPKPSPAWEAKQRADKEVSKALRQVLLRVSKLDAAMAWQERTRAALEQSLGRLVYTPRRGDRRKAAALVRGKEAG